MSPTGKGATVAQQEVIAEIPENVREYLRSRPILTLATASPTGVAHATTLVFASDDHALYVWLRPDTVTARQIDENPGVALTIDEYSTDWSQIRGIQASATAKPILDPATIERVVDLFTEKFSDLTVADTGSLSFLRLVPRQLHFIDNAAHHGEGGQKKALGQDFHRDLIYSVFRDLPPAHVDSLVGRLETMSVDAGEVVVRQGAPADKFFIIIDGEVEVVRVDDDDQAHEVARLGPGQFFGEVAVLRDIPRTATVRAVSPTTLLTMDRDTFRSLVAQSLSTTENLDDIIRQRLERL